MHAVTKEALVHMTVAPALDEGRRHLVRQGSG